MRLTTWTSARTSVNVPSLWEMRSLRSPAGLAMKTALPQCSSEPMSWRTLWVSGASCSGRGSLVRSTTGSRASPLARGKSCLRPRSLHPADGRSGARAISWVAPCEGQWDVRDWPRRLHAITPGNQPCRRTACCPSVPRRMGTGARSPRAGCPAAPGIRSLSIRTTGGNTRPRWNPRTRRRPFTLPVPCSAPRSNRAAARGYESRWLHIAALPMPAKESQVAAPGGSPPGRRTVDARSRTVSAIPVFGIGFPCDPGTSGWNAGRTNHGPINGLAISPGGIP
jgi:hypothetical protein